MTIVAEIDEPRLPNDLPAPAIETIGLTRAFGDHVAVSNVAFSVLRSPCGPARSSD